MAQDFAKNKSSTTRSSKPSGTRKPSSSRQKTKQEKPKSNSRRGATKNQRSNNTNHRKSPPLWAWIIIGACLIGFGFFLTELPKNEQTAVKNSKEQNDIEIPVDKETSQVKFDFYEILKGKEINVDERIVEKTPERKNIIYFLQAGSFRTVSDADTLRAKLILQGLPVEIDTTNGKGNLQWHRVIAGPFDTRSKLAKARSVLASNEINSIVIKRQK